MFKLERILHFAAAIVTQLIHMSAALAYSPLLSLAAQHHQSIRLHRTVFRRRMMLTRDVQIPEFLIHILSTSVILHP